MGSFLLGMVHGFGQEVMDQRREKAELYKQQQKFQLEQEAKKNERKLKDAAAMQKQLQERAELVLNARNSVTSAISRAGLSEDLEAVGDSSRRQAVIDSIVQDVYTSDLTGFNEDYKSAESMDLYLKDNRDRHFRDITGTPLKLRENQIMQQGLSTYAAMQREFGGPAYSENDLILYQSSADPNKVVITPAPSTTTKEAEIHGNAWREFYMKSWNFDIGEDTAYLLGKNKNLQLLPVIENGEVVEVILSRYNVTATDTGGVSITYMNAADGSEVETIPGNRSTHGSLPENLQGSFMGPSSQPPTSQQPTSQDLPPIDLGVEVGDHANTIDFGRIGGGFLREYPPSERLARVAIEKGAEPIPVESLNTVATKINDTEAQASNNSSVSQRPVENLPISSQNPDIARARERIRATYPQPLTPEQRRDMVKKQRQTTGFVKTFADLAGQASRADFGELVGLGAAVNSFKGASTYYIDTVLEQVGGRPIWGPKTRSEKYKTKERINLALKTKKSTEAYLALVRSMHESGRIPVTYYEEAKEAAVKVGDLTTSPEEAHANFQYMLGHMQRTLFQQYFDAGLAAGSTDKDILKGLIQTYVDVYGEDYRQEISYMVAKQFLTPGYYIPVSADVQ